MAAESDQLAAEWFAVAQDKQISSARFSVQKAFNLVSNSERTWVIRSGAKVTEDIGLLHGELSSTYEGISLTHQLFTDEVQRPLDLVNTADGSQVHFEFSSEDTKAYLVVYWDPKAFASKAGVHYLEGLLGRNSEFVQQLEVLLVSVDVDIEKAQKIVASKSWKQFKSFALSTAEECNYAHENIQLPQSRLVYKSDVLATLRPNDAKTVSICKDIISLLNQAFITDEEAALLVAQAADIIQTFANDHPSLERNLIELSRVKTYRPDLSFRASNRLTVLIGLPTSEQAAAKELEAALRSAFSLEIQFNCQGV
mmetsp:Transcript_1352/g.3123  ORF Transcript_1352/g.3123 Transcript_1352/m.3123 type:complete len:311 (+) Transcript_1352:497-1429(+)|eukprot:CAMPEP_0204908940 /NCGR_PEP_ID=MMETSP1397-20131031/7791_1 /ASSEMBLY_ACC=CAM_ASM_000891 /TAXON_ID=49980 /ORGANISM="Climacostomum Climacostomum virens, Strain Stock W-24" /LENGTH=310 /DNA_ID=CAMNT_0052078639 /DNA_START=453 /DNA_END=1385 /DNA_ORIENTATION=+